jgi:hypothetical protein
MPAFGIRIASCHRVPEISRDAVFILFFNSEKFIQFQGNTLRYHVPQVWHYNGEYLVSLGAQMG